MLLFCCTLDQINAGLVSRRDFFKNIKNLTVQKLLTDNVYKNLSDYLHDIWTLTKSENYANMLSDYWNMNYY